jgi:hypothetical protein
MKYPTMEQVDAATHEQLGRWSRFLCSPGLDAAGTDHFKQTMASERAVMERILERFQAFGGWNPTLSKQVGWEP